MLSDIPSNSPDSLPPFPYHPYPTVPDMVNAGDKIYDFRSLHEKQLQKAEMICGHKFEDKNLLYEALLMAGTPVGFVLPGLQRGNERLANVGDRVLSLVVTLHTYARGDNISEFLVL